MTPHYQKRQTVILTQPKLRDALSGCSVFYAAVRNLQQVSFNEYTLPDRDNYVRSNHETITIRDPDSGKFICQYVFIIPIVDWIPTVCPYGNIGDTLYVRESYAIHNDFNPKFNEIQPGVIAYKIDNDLGNARELYGS